jgi:hypothetical protein
VVGVFRNLSIARQAHVTMILLASSYNVIMVVADLVLSLADAKTNYGMTVLLIVVPLVFSILSARFNELMASLRNSFF